jgi:hypothetical protein
MWTILNAQKIVSNIQRAIRKKYGYNVCIYGSVLYKGYSKNDLDIQLIPFAHSKDNYNNHREIAEAVSNSINGYVKDFMVLKAIGEMCYIVEFNNEQSVMRIDMVIRRIVPYIPTHEEILKEAGRIKEIRQLLKLSKI